MQESWKKIHRWLEQANTNTRDVTTWSSEERLERCQLLRDASLYALEHDVAAKDADALRALVDLVEEPHVVAHIKDLHISYHPTAQMKLLRFVEPGELDREHASLFARPCKQMPHLCAVFVDPREFNYRNFEQIVPLDRLAKDKELSFEFSQFNDLKEGVHALSLGASESTASWLLGLDPLNLYLQPPETNARGGRRFIFHCAALADALTEAAKKSLPPEMLRGFSHVNPVFRCNRFAPQDAPFATHLDAPYYDPNRGHISTHTLILYLTGGHGEGVLEVEDVTIDEIAPMSATIFHQSLAHKGTPFEEGDKIFLRTELIYEVDPGQDLDHDPGIAAIFSKACYMDRQSLFHPELSSYMQRCYERVNRAHWEGLDASEGEPEPFVRKRFRSATGAQTTFLANGYDFWFRDDISLKQCAALTLIDALNATFPFEIVVHSAALEPRRGVDWIPEFLHGQERSPCGVHLDLNKKRFFESQPGEMGKSADLIDYEVNYMDEEPYLEPIDVSLHTLVRDGRMRKAWKLAQSFCKQLIEPAPILIMGQTVFLDPERILVHGDRIFITSEELLEPVHFAADVYTMERCLPQNFLDVDFMIEAPYLLIPPITWRHIDGCYHLTLDFFYNSWMLKTQPRSVPIPSMRPMRYKRKSTLPESDAPWLNAASLVSDEARTFKRQFPGNTRYSW